MAFLDFLIGSPGKTEKLPTMSNEQQALLTQLLQQLSGGGLKGGYNESLEYLRNLLEGGEGSFEQFASPYKQEFESQIIPGIAERFAGKGALSSSGFGQALSSAGAGLTSQLAALKAGLQKGAAQDLLSQYQNTLGLGLGAKPYGYQSQQGQPGLLQPLLQGLGQALPMMF